MKAAPTAAAGQQRTQHGAAFGGESLQRTRHVLVVLRRRRQFAQRMQRPRAFAERGFMTGIVPPVAGGAHLLSAA